MFRSSADVHIVGIFFAIFEKDLAKENDNVFMFLSQSVQSKSYQLGVGDVKGLDVCIYTEMSTLMCVCVCFTCRRTRRTGGQ